MTNKLVNPGVRSKLLRAVVTPVEAELIAAAAHQLNKSVSAFLRELALAAALATGGNEK